MIRYTPDAATKTLAIVRGEAVLLVPVPAWTAHPGLWEALGAADPVEAVLGELARDGIVALPDFALVVAAPGSLRVVVRGGFRVRTAGDTVTAAGVSTWHERALETDAVFEVLAPFARKGAGVGPLPMVEGVVPAHAVSRGELDAQDAEPGAEPRSSVARDAERRPEAEPEPRVVRDVEPGPEPELEPELEPEPEPEPVAPEHTLVPADDETIVIGTGAGNGIAAAAAASEPTAAPVTGDHDGLTVAVTKLQRLRRERVTGPLAADGAAPPSPEPEAPRLRLVLDDGREEALTGEIVLGRSPSAGRSSGTSLPKLVQIGVGDPDISRSHLRLAVEGGTVVVTDLQSRNGTTVVQPDRAPVKLRAGEPTPVLAGTLIDLGGGCTMRVVAD